MKTISRVASGRTKRHALVNGAVKGGTSFEKKIIKAQLSAAYYYYCILFNRKQTAALIIVHAKRLVVGSGI